MRVSKVCFQAHAGSVHFPTASVSQGRTAVGGDVGTNRRSEAGRWRLVVRRRGSRFGRVRCRFACRHCEQCNLARGRCGAILNELARNSPEKLDWKTSIVDMMKLLKREQAGKQGFAGPRESLILLACIFSCVQAGLVFCFC
ncbi:DUF3597 family protein [Polaromonas sp. A23]|uniref:DUF3597 family protein n=1 Tax=Polaromonas sp. A23 TaxID=1944133 RepID=UPI0009D0AFDD|nr:DUF3597 family protein [Polaromonas sp. A23]OOG44206.1 hypothetical protein B0B52_07475 [Polaromonas sp. A23]